MTFDCFQGGEILGLEKFISRIKWFNSQYLRHIGQNFLGEDDNHLKIQTQQNT